MKNIFIRLFLFLILSLVSGNAFATIVDHREFLHWQYGERIYLFFIVSVSMLLFSPLFLIASNYLTLRNKGTQIQKQTLHLLFWCFISSFPIYLLLKFLNHGLIFWLESNYYDLADLSNSMLLTSPVFLIALIFLILSDKGLIKERKTICWLFVFYASSPFLFRISILAFWKIKQTIGQF